jgi:hypothetical protein
VLITRWREDGRGGAVYEDDQLIGLVSLVADWYEPQSREPQAAWVVQFLEPGVEGLPRVLVELDADPATDEARQADLAKSAKAIAEQGPPATPAPFGSALTGLKTMAQIRELIRLTNYGLQSAQDRVFAAAGDDRPQAVMPLLIAVTDLMAWLRGLDELANYVWKERLTDRKRERASKHADRFMDSPGAAPGLLAGERKTRQKAGHPYPDWSIALLANPMGWLRREELTGFRWLAGKMLHFGPLSVVELKQWRAGERPRWKWRHADRILSARVPEQRKTQRKVYNKVVAGKDVVGSFQANELAFSVERLFLPLLQ